MVLLTLLLIICGFGLLMVYDASILTGYRLFEDQYHFLKRQSVMMILGFIALFISLRLPIAWWRRNTNLFVIGTIILLVLVLIPGISDKTLGARRWISLGPFAFQPSEIAKISVILYLAEIFSTNPKPQKEFLKIMGIVIGLLMMEPDLGTTLVLITTSISMYWVSGAPLKHFGAIVMGGLMGILGLIITSPYRLRRLLTFFQPENDPLGASYHVRQILIAIGSGSWLGIGLGQSRQKYAYLPEVQTDSIFAIVAEELGFLGSIILILMFLILFLRGLHVVANLQDPYLRLLATGLTCWIAFQAFINLSAMVILVPLTGIPLPFVSYGGSSLIIALASMGLLLNISRNSSK